MAFFYDLIQSFNPLNDELFEVAKQNHSHMEGGAGCGFYQVK